MSDSPAAILFDVHGSELATVSGVGGVSLHTETTLDTSSDHSYVDAFQRLRVSFPRVLFDSKQVFSNQSLLFSEKEVGNGTVTYQAGQSRTELAVTTVSGDRAVRQTKRYFNYQPGKSQLTLVTFNLNGPVLDVDKCVGLYDDDNGGFLFINGTAAYLCQRSDTSGSPVDTQVPQSSWNIDNFDGTGPSGVNLDFTKTQILLIDFEWLGVGSMRMGFVVDGNVCYAHRFSAANILDVVYMRTPNLPVRWEIKNTATSVGADMHTICCSVMSEGGQEPTGIARSISRGIDGLTTDNTRRPVLAARLKSGSVRAPVVPLSLAFVSATKTDFFWELVLNPARGTGTSPNWIALSDSSVEYDVTSTEVLVGGTVLDSGYASSKVRSVDVVLNTFLTISADIDGNTDELVVAITSLTDGNEEFFSSLTFLELA